MWLLSGFPEPSLLPDPQSRFVHIGEENETRRNDALLTSPSLVADPGLRGKAGRAAGERGRRGHHLGGS